MISNVCNPLPACNCLSKSSLELVIRRFKLRTFFLIPSPSATTQTVFSIANVADVPVNNRSNYSQIFLLNGQMTGVPGSHPDAGKTDTKVFLELQWCNIKQELLAVICNCIMGKVNTFDSVFNDVPKEIGQEKPPPKSVLTEVYESVIVSFIMNIPLMSLRYFPRHYAILFGSACYGIMIAVFIYFLYTGFERVLTQQFVAVTPTAGICR